MPILGWRQAAALVACAALLTGCGGGSDAGADSADGGSEGKAAGATVEMKLLQYEPKELTVKAGTTVRFRNAEPITHTVTTGTYTVGEQGFRTSETKDGALDKSLGSKGDEVTYTFAEPGTYQYFCTIHKAMQGRIVVQ